MQPMLTRASEQLQVRPTTSGYERVLRLPNGSAAWIALADHGDALAVDILAADPGATPAAIEHFVRQWLDLDRDLAPFHTAAAQHPQFAAIAARYDGLRLYRTPDLFEALIWSVLGQQVNTAFAAQLKHAVTQAYGHVFPGSDLWVVPAPEVLAEVNPELLRPLKLSGAKARNLVGLAQAVAQGRLTLAQLEALPDDEAFAHLTAFPGIGPWTANYVLLRCLGRVARAPYGDAALHSVVHKLLQLDHKPTEADIRRFLGPLAPWAGYATVYLWRAKAEL